MYRQKKPKPPEDLFGKKTYGVEQNQKKTRANSAETSKLINQETIKNSIDHNHTPLKKKPKTKNLITKIPLNQHTPKL